MIDEQTPARIVERIVVAEQPKRIILFGSDLDIPAVKPQLPDEYAEMIRRREAVGNPGVGVDMLVYSEAEHAQRSQVPGTLPYWANMEGRELYEAAS